jgi:hypothetical protein
VKSTTSPAITSSYFPKTEKICRVAMIDDFIHEVTSFDSPIPMIDGIALSNLRKANG